MNFTLKTIVLSSLCIGLAFTSCKEEKKLPPKAKVKKEVKAKKVTPKPKPVTKPQEKKVEKPKNKYFLIAASFQNPNNAKQFQAYLSQQGFESHIHEAENGFFRVSYKGFSERKEAFNELKNDRATEEHRDVWLYIKS